MLGSRIYEELFHVANTAFKIGILEIKVSLPLIIKLISGRTLIYTYGFFSYNDLNHELGLYLELI